MPRKEGSNDILPVGETPTGVIDCIVLIDEGCGRGKIMVGENAGHVLQIKVVMCNGILPVGATQAGKIHL